MRLIEPRREPDRVDRAPEAFAGTTIKFFRGSILPRRLQIMPPVFAGVLQRAVTLLAHLELDIHRGREGRGWLAHDLVVGRPFHRLVPEILVPDLADAGVVPADHIIAGLCGN